MAGSKGRKTAATTQRAKRGHRPTDPKGKGAEPAKAATRRKVAKKKAAAATAATPRRTAKRTKQADTTKTATPRRTAKKPRTAGTRDAKQSPKNHEPKQSGSKTKQAAGRNRADAASWWKVWFDALNGLSQKTHGDSESSRDQQTASNTADPTAWFKQWQNWMQSAMSASSSPFGGNMSDLGKAFDLGSMPNVADPTAWFKQWQDWMQSAMSASSSPFGGNMSDLGKAFDLGSMPNVADPTAWFKQWQNWMQSAMTRPGASRDSGAAMADWMKQWFGPGQTSSLGLTWGLPSKELLDPAAWTRIWQRFQARQQEVVEDFMDANPFVEATRGERPDQKPMAILAETLYRLTSLKWMPLAPKLLADAMGKLTKDAVEYMVDMGQRRILFMDAMRQRGNNMLAHYEAGMPPLLAYDYEVLLDARTFDRPANYLLLRIKDPHGRKPAPGHRPIVIIDPRAGHGPGIGGFKKDSEVGMALTEGHPTYFVVFTPDPMPNQTIEDVELAEIRFIEEVYRRHPKEGRPIVYGNCQAGWAVAMLGADRPDVTGPIVINGAPLSYWSGGAGVNPMRVTGGLIGGSWATRMLCDLGCGVFDGAHLVMNFEHLNPANTLWKKDYNLFSKIDTERERYLEFERWWTGFYFLNEDEILWIVDNLFIGDKLEHGRLRLSPSHHVDMRNMDDPLVVFASSGDNISPPQQALNWISEVYKDTDDLKRAGQRIVYLLNPHIGHLGIFVSAGVARKEHRAIIEHIERIRALKPGLYQMVIEGETGEPDRLKDQFIVRFEERRIEDVRFPFDRKAFEKTAAVSRANEELYIRYGRPLVRAMITPPVAMALKWLNPARVSRYMYAEKVNPWMHMFVPWTRQVEQHRMAVDDSNTFRYAEHRLAENLTSLLDAVRDIRDNASEILFDATYL